jgi:transcriptional regulator with XRE-family HTH domain
MHNNENVTVGKNLKYLRDLNQFTQEMTADALGIARTTYENYESGRREAPISVLERVSDLFGCELEQLFSQEIQQQGVLVCTFRQDGLTASDLNAIADFKALAKQYMKLKRLSLV